MSQGDRLEPFAYGCRGCGRVARTTRELTAAGCEGKHEPLISRADHEAEVGRYRSALETVKPFLSGGQVHVVLEALADHPKDGQTG